MIVGFLWRCQSNQARRDRTARIRDNLRRPSRYGQLAEVEQDASHPRIIKMIAQATFAIDDIIMIAVILTKPKEEDHLFGLVQAGIKQALHRRFVGWRARPSRSRLGRAALRPCSRKRHRGGVGVHHLRRGVQQQDRLGALFHDGLEELPAHGAPPGVLGTTALRPFDGQQGDVVRAAPPHRTRPGLPVTAWQGHLARARPWSAR